MKRLLTSLVLVVAFCGMARAEEAPQRVVDAALATYANMTSDPDFANLNSLLARDGATGLWSQPAFVTLASGSIGLQIGGSVSQVVLVVMTDNGLDAMLKDKVTLGGEASVAAGPVGAGVNAQSTSDVNNDVYSYAKAQGLFAGAAIEGAVLEPDPDRNRFYYGETFSTRQIVMGQASPNAGADALRAALAGY